ncbi:hypothetical protein NO2_0718 [Candidatus Termititenax persephonae]|uniref:DUF3800 domain-containing protein n=1 Tax=Candidatus Termititenax persephonae TaxID=2218525 RepID=A0A388TG97_9BACT|nr:hypothetical protein NO2_0718 [Candidatus Termititenax persephonae]
MWYLYLDESGDLGFDFKHKTTSKYFTITILCFEGVANNRSFNHAVRKTLARKMNFKKRKFIFEEIKGTNTTLDTKKYLYKFLQKIDFSIYAITIDKQKVMRHISEDKSRFYNYVAKLVLDKIPLEKADKAGIEFVIDKSKAKTEIARFDYYIRQHLQSRINPNTPFNINHGNSKELQCIQVADIFCWGIFQKYEHNRTDWLNIFKKKIAFDGKYAG